MIIVPVYRAAYLNIFGLNLKFAIFFLIGLAAFLAFLALFLFESKRKKLDRKETIIAFVIGYIGAMIGARFFFYFMPWWTYSENWSIGERIIKFLSFFDSGMVFYGGVIGALIAIWIYFKIRKINFWKYMDAIAPAFAIGFAIARIGCFVVDDTCRGIRSNLPWAVLRINDNGEILHSGPIHPAPLYISLSMLILFVILWRLRKKELFDGWLALTALMFDSVTRFLIEFVRYYPVKLFGWITPSHVVSFVVFSLCLFIFVKKYKEYKKSKISKKNKEI